MIEVIATMMWLELLESPGSLHAGTRGLTSIVYRTNDPSRSQISSIRRAVGSMERRHQVEVRSWADDLRVKVVRLSPWMRPVLYELLDPGVEDVPSLEHLSRLIDGLKGLVNRGWISIHHNGVALSAKPHSLIIDGDMVDAHLEFPSEGPTLDIKLLFARRPQE